MYPELSLYIDGEWRPGSNGKSEEVINPATEEVLAVLLTAGADTESRNSYAFTPLMVAAQNNKAEAVRVLAKAGADPMLVKGRFQFFGTA